MRKTSIIAAALAIGILTLTQSAHGARAANGSAARSSAAVKRLDGNQAAAAIPEAQAALRDAGWLILDYEPALEGKEFLVKGIVRPDRWELQPISLDIAAQLTAERPATFFIAPPRDLFDQANVAGKIVVSAQGKTLRGDEIKTEVVYSKKSEKNPYVNPVYKITLKGPLKDLTIQAICWVMVPVSRIARPQAQRLVRANIAQSQTAVIKHALEVACSITYDRNLHGLDPSVTKANGWRGDCGQKAAWAKKEANGLLDVAVGYATTPKQIQDFDGHHVVNFGKVRAGGFIVDAVGARGVVRPQNPDHLAASLGGWADVEIPLRDRPVTVGNGGNWLGNGIQGFQKLRVSTAFAGPQASMLAELKVPPAVETYFELRRALRMAVYKRPRAAE